MGDKKYLEFPGSLSKYKMVRTSNE